MELYYFIKEEKFSYNYYDIEDLEAILQSEEYLPPYYYDHGKMYQVYELINSKKVIVVNNEAVSIFFNIGDFRKVYNDITANLIIQEEIMFNKNPYHNNFVEVAKDIGEGFIKELGLNFQDSTYSLLKKVDDIINRDNSRKEYVEKNFIKVLALIGELLRTKHKGINWEVELSNIDKQTWSPYIRYKNRKIPIFLHLFEYIESEKDFDNVLTDFYDSMEALLVR